MLLDEQKPGRYLSAADYFAQMRPVRAQVSKELSDRVKRRKSR
jgi:hypothetical protein